MKSPDNDLNLQPGFLTVRCQTDLSPETEKRAVGAFPALLICIYFIMSISFFNLNL
jgi:hypothetical protein